MNDRSAWMRKHNVTFRHIKIAILLVALALIGIRIYFLFPRISHCRAVIGYAGDKRIITTVGIGKEHRAVRTSNGQRYANDIQNLAYDRISDSWVYEYDSRLIRNHRGKESVIVIEGGTGSVGYGQVVMREDKIYECYLCTDDLYHVMRYDLHGRFEHDLTLHMPNPSKSDEDGRSEFDISKTGEVAVVIDSKKHSTDTYLFDNKGKLIKRFDNGYDVRFDPSGNKLAFSNFEKVDEPGIFFSKGTSNTVVYELKTGKRRVIPDMCYWIGIDGWLHYVEGGHSYHWSKDGRWLILETTAYPVGINLSAWSPSVLSTLDLSAKKPRLEYLRRLPNGCWNKGWTVVY